MYRYALVAAWCAAALPALADQRCDTSQYALSAPSERYVDNGDGTVTDTVTQLMWMRCSQGQRFEQGRCLGAPVGVDWAAAQAAAEQVNAAGDFFYGDWRLPSITEIAAIVERQCSAPRINLSVFPATPPETYWSATSRPKDPELVYALGFGEQGVVPEPRQAEHHVRLVRNGP
jgi:hypothetical protein